MPDILQRRDRLRQISGEGRDALEPTLLAVRHLLIDRERGRVIGDLLQIDAEGGNLGPEGDGAVDRLGLIAHLFAPRFVTGQNLSSAPTPRGALSLPRGGALCADGPRRARPR